MRPLRAGGTGQQAADEFRGISCINTGHAVDIGTSTRAAVNEAGDELLDVGTVTRAVAVHVTQAGARRQCRLRPEAAFQIEVAAGHEARIGLADGAFEFEITAGAVTAAAVDGVAGDFKIVSECDGRAND